MADSWDDVSKVMEEGNRNTLEYAEAIGTIKKALEDAFGYEPSTTFIEEHLKDIIRLENEIDEKERDLQKAHVSRLTKNKCTPQAGMIFSDVVSGLERVADHATNIAFSIHEKDGVKYLD